MEDRCSKRKKLFEFVVQQVLESDMTQSVECAEVTVDTVEPDFFAEPYIPPAPEVRDMMTRQCIPLKILTLMTKPFILYRVSHIENLCLY